MGILEDVMKALERVPGWKRIAETPARMDDLEKRLKALEARLETGKGSACPKCREPAYVIQSSAKAKGPMGNLGLKDYVCECSACGYRETHTDTKPPI